MEKWTIMKINKRTEKRNQKGEWKATALNSPKPITSGLAEGEVVVWAAWNEPHYSAALQ